jgi:hypothetical protein
MCRQKRQEEYSSLHNQKALDNNERRRPIFFDLTACIRTSAYSINADSLNGFILKYSNGDSRNRNVNILRLDDITIDQF